MHTRSSSNLIVESSTILKRRNRRRSKQIVEPELCTIVETPVATMADTRTMSELLQAPTEGYGDAIVIPTILAENFELKVGLLQLLFTTRSGVAYDGPTIPPTPSPLPKEVEHETEMTKDKVQTTSSESTAHVQPPVIQVPIPEPEVVSKLNTKSLHFDISFADALLDMPKFASTFKSLLIDYDVDPRVPLILGRPFLRTAQALIDVHGEELTLRVNDEAITFKVRHTSRYSRNYYDETVHQVSVIDIACEEYAQEVLGFLDSSTRGDFVLEEIEACLLSDSIPLRIDDAEFDLEGDILLLEKLLNDDPSSPLLSNELNFDPWVIPVHCVPKKGGMTVVENEDNELIPTRLVTGWRVCIDYCKLNDATCKDHFPLPFMDQMLERLAGNEYYCFLDEFLGYFQIPIDLEDQEKTTFTCPYGTFAYQRTPFGLCNAPGTFQRCMMAIFHDMIKETMEVFMEDFSVFGDSFSSCFSHLDKMLKRCEDTNLVLNWEKCHFMVKEGIVLGHKISKSRIEVDRAKVDVIAKLPHPTSVKAFNILKKKLTEAPILVAPDWDLPFEIMCDASDYAILLLQEFNVIIRDKKGAKNLVADHLSGLENPHQSNLEKKEINETFALETLRMVTFHGDSSTPWFADIANYHAGNFVVKGMSSQQKKKIL
ncbi:reverse transcriptase domain-containing protein [Tanacetum coccineum]